MDAHVQSLAGRPHVLLQAHGGAHSVRNVDDAFNGGARKDRHNPEHHDRMKHVERRHFFVRDMVESFEISVPFVRTADNLADFFTKPMKSASQFHALRKRIMNEQS